MANYLPPAGIDDFSRGADPADLHTKWHRRTSDMLGYIMGKIAIDGKFNTRVSPLFYDQLADTSGIADSDPAKIPWNAFPLRLEKWFNPTNAADTSSMFEKAETLLDFGYLKLNGNRTAPVPAPFRIQDEYCEWHVTPGATPGSVARIHFTCEPPEYWTFLADNAPDLLVTLYRELLGHAEIKKEDLFWQHDVFARGNNGLEKVYKTGEYNPNNKWNTQLGAIHLTHPANSLNAEMFLASDSTFGWPAGNGPVSSEKLMCCAGVGGINRSSDPLILAGVFNFAKDDNSVALANPIGLYIMPFQLDLLDPDGNPIGDQALKVVRASPDGTKWLRVEVAPPAGATYTLDQCFLGGASLKYGGQIAKLITMAIFGVAKKIPGKTKKKINSCPSFCCEHPEHSLFKGTFANRPNASCASITPQEWAQEAYDIPTDANVPLLAEAAANVHIQLSSIDAIEEGSHQEDKSAKALVVPSKKSLAATLGRGRGLLSLDGEHSDQF